MSMVLSKNPRTLLEQLLSTRQTELTKQLSKQQHWHGKRFLMQLLGKSNLRVNGLLLSGKHTQLQNLKVTLQTKLKLMKLLWTRTLRIQLLRLAIQLMRSQSKKPRTLLEQLLSTRQTELTKQLSKKQHWHGKWFFMHLLGKSNLWVNGLLLSGKHTQLQNLKVTLQLRLKLMRLLWTRTLRIQLLRLAIQLMRPQSNQVTARTTVIMTTMVVTTQILN